MARRVLDVTIDAVGRDKGKVFRLTEMPATRAEKWAARAFLALARSGIDVPEDIAAGGLAGIAQIGFQALSAVNFADAEPLMDEMLECVSFVPDPAKPDVVRRLIEDDTEEVATLAKIRMEVWTLHTGFSLPGAPSKLTTDRQTAE